MKSAFSSLVLGSILLACAPGTRNSNIDDTNGGTTGGGNNGGNNGGNGGVIGTIFGPGATTLLVDNEWANASVAFTSPSYTTYTALLTGAGIAYDTFVTDPNGTDGAPSSSDIAPYDTIVWFTGGSYGGGVGEATMTAAQEAIVTNWLDQGGRTLLLFSENLVYDLSNPHCIWGGPETDVFLVDYIGAAGDECDFPCDVCTGGKVDHESYAITPATGSPLGAEPYQVVADTPVESTADAINPGVGAGVDILATVPLDPDGNGDLPGAVVTGRKGVGALGTSQVVYVGVPVEDFTTLTGYGDATGFFNGVLNYAGL
ncbi:MAG TPA: hypothetical protein VMB50_09520 [Myxococcales bacterium]|nr:hypothetical protein [Myxococcales bacterium]